VCLEELVVRDGAAQPTARMQIPGCAAFRRNLSRRPAPARARHQNERALGLRHGEEQVLYPAADGRCWRLAVQREPDRHRQEGVSGPSGDAAHRGTASSSSKQDDDEADPEDDGVPPTVALLVPERPVDRAQAAEDGCHDGGAECDAGHPLHAPQGSHGESGTEADAVARDPPVPVARATRRPQRASLRLLSRLDPDRLRYQPNWKASATHPAFRGPVRRHSTT
jgi:hypothetical protein